MNLLGSLFLIGFGIVFLILSAPLRLCGKSSDPDPEDEDEDTVTGPLPAPTA